MVSSQVYQPAEQEAEKILKQFLALGTQAAHLATAVIMCVQKEITDNPGVDLKELFGLPLLPLNETDHHDEKED